MALILLTAAELGAQSDFLLNIDWMMYASKVQLDPSKTELTLVLGFGVTIENPPIGAAKLDEVFRMAFFGCPDPDAVLLRISQAR